MTQANHRPLVLFGCAVAVYAAVWAAWLVLRPFGEFALTAFSDIAGTVPAYLAGALAVWASAAGRGRTRAGWLLIGLGMLSWGVGNTIWAYYEVYLRSEEIPFPSLADAGYLLMVPLVFWGLVLLASPERLLTKARTMLDGIALVLGVSALMWHLILRPIYSDSSVGNMEKVLGGAYPLGDLALFFGLVLALSRHRSREATVVLATFTAGLGMFLAADVGFAYSTLQGTYATGSIVDYGWTYGLLMIAFAAALQRGLRPEYADRVTPLSDAAWRQSAPLVLLLLLFAGALYYAWQNQLRDPVFTIMIVTAMGAIVVRQFVVLRDNVGLNRALVRSGEVLEARVVERTEALRTALDSERRANESARRLSAILDATPDVVATADARGHLVYLNESGRRITGIDQREEITEVPFSSIFSNWARDLIREVAVPSAQNGGAWRGESALAARDGTDVPVSSVILAHGESDGERYTSLIGRDLSERRQFETQLVHMASHDGLTGLYNHRRMQEEIATYLAELGRSGGWGAVLFIDLDDFKKVNDSLGHRAGDELLSGVAKTIRGQLREGDNLGRMGGDEFAVLLKGADEAQAMATANRIVDALRRFRAVLSDELVGTTASIGVVVIPQNGSTAEEALVHADVAMYHAKATKDSVCLYADSDDSQERFATERVWQQRIRDALDDSGFVLYAQPICDLRDGTVRHYELLLRMIAEDGSVSPPGDFLPIAERSGLIQKIDRWVITSAIELLTRCQADRNGIVFEVNVSGRAVTDATLPALIEDRLRVSGADPSGLVIEITESSAIADLERAKDFITRLKGIGCRFAIDDFGVGFSSFYYLKHLPVDYLKIDGSFIRNLPEDVTDQHLVRAMVEVARGLGKSTIAEFVSSAETMDTLREIGVDYGQGYYLGRPVPVETLFGEWSSQEPGDATAA